MAQIWIGADINVAFAAVLYLNAARIGHAEIVWIASICLGCAVLFLCCKLWYHLKVTRYLRTFPDSLSPSATYDLLGWLACGLGVLSYTAVLVYSKDSATPAPPIGKLLSMNWNMGFTALALLSLFVANAFYQFVDVTQWQRLLSIGVNAQDRAATNNVLRTNVLAGGICSSLTWVIAVAFGVFLKHLYPDHDPYTVLSHFASELAVATGPLHNMVLFVFIASLVAVMFSTLDSLVAGTAFTVQNDILTGVFQHSERARLLLARISTIIVLILQLALYLLVSQIAGDRVDAVLYVCWSFQLAMFPVVVAVLLGRGGRHWARVVAMLAGSCAALWPLVSGEPDRVYEISPWLAVLISTAVFILLGGQRVARVAVVKSPVG